jgi:gentisate 1,2-dioxygenase
MHPGDLILTPSWTYHDHGNPSAEPVVWLDGLDIPTVNFFDTSFAEHGSGEMPPEPSRDSAPVSYPYREARAALDQLRRSGPPHASHGVKMQYLDPATGRSPLPTLGAFLQLLPAGFRGTPSRATDATVYCCVEGAGVSRVGDHAFSWGPHDVFVVPSWCLAAHESGPESVLFSFSDRPAQQALGLWREA